MIDLREISQAVIEGNAPRTKELTQKAIQAGMVPGKILHDGLVPGMNVVGDKFRNNEYYVPEVLIAARAMNTALDILKPLLAQNEDNYKGKVVIGTVKGDLHDIGKNIAAMMLEGAGFQVIDLGVDVSPEKVVEAVRQNKPNILGMSALLTTTMAYMKETITALKNEALRENIKIIIGGAPITEDFARIIGADGYAPDAATGVEVASKILGQS